MFLLLPLHHLSLKKACLSDGISRCLVDMELETQRVQTQAIPFFCQIGRPCTTIGFVTSRSCAAAVLSLSLSLSLALTPPDLSYITCTICRLPGCFHFCGSEVLDSGLAVYLNWSPFSCSIPAA
jgi:hypothetical protein